MKQTPSAIIVLAAAILGAGASVSFSTSHNNLGATLCVLATFTGIVGSSFLVRACLYDHEIAIDVSGRLDFLEELVYLEKLALEHRKRRNELAREAKGDWTARAAQSTYERPRTKAA